MTDFAVARSDGGRRGRRLPEAIEAVIGKVCGELEITRQTLYRHVSPTDELAIGWASFSPPAAARRGENPVCPTGLPECRAAHEPSKAAREQGSASARGTAA